MHDKSSQQVNIEENYLSLIKSVHKTSADIIILNGESLDAFPLRSGTRQQCPLSLLLFSIGLEVLVTVVRHEKEKITQIRKI